MDDSNWDASFEIVLNKLLSRHDIDGIGAVEPTEWGGVRPVVRRIQHVGTCGSHVRQSSHCVAKVRDWAPAIGQYISKLANTAARVDTGSTEAPGFAWILKPTSLAPATMYGGRPNGGWGDSRDHALCNKLPNMRYAVDGSKNMAGDQGPPMLLGLDQVLTTLPFVAESVAGVDGSGIHQ